MGDFYGAQSVLRNDEDELQHPLGYVSKCINLQIPDIIKKAISRGYEQRLKIATRALPSWDLKVFQSTDELDFRHRLLASPRFLSAGKGNYMCIRIQKWSISFSAYQKANLMPQLLWQLPNVALYFNWWVHAETPRHIWGFLIDDFANCSATQVEYGRLIEESLRRRIDERKALYLMEGTHWPLLWHERESSEGNARPGRQGA
jgi:hypothetical protein